MGHTGGAQEGSGPSRRQCPQPADSATLSGEPLPSIAVRSEWVSPAHLSVQVGPPPNPGQNRPRWLRSPFCLPFLILVLQMFKGPDKDIEFIYTAPSSAICGVSLDVGGKKEYLIAGMCVGVDAECCWRLSGAGGVEQEEQPAGNLCATLPFPRTPGAPSPTAPPSHVPLLQ